MDLREIAARARRARRPVIREKFQEPFVATLKAEAFADHLPLTREAARLLIFDYIEPFTTPTVATGHPAIARHSSSKNKLFSPNKQTLNTNNPN
jgi:hypothetical protein